jgi:hypothetical protein
MNTKAVLDKVIEFYKEKEIDHQKIVQIVENSSNLYNPVLKEYIHDINKIAKCYTSCLKKKIFSAKIKLEELCGWILDYQNNLESLVKTKKNNDTEELLEQKKEFSLANEILELYATTFNPKLGDYTTQLHKLAKKERKIPDIKKGNEEHIAKLIYQRDLFNFYINSKLTTLGLNYENIIEYKEKITSSSL